MVKKWTFWTDPRWGCVFWGIGVPLSVYEGNIFMATVGAFFLGIAVQRIIDASSDRQTS